MACAIPPSSVLFLSLQGYQIISLCIIIHLSIANATSKVCLLTLIYYIYVNQVDLHYRCLIMADATIPAPLSQFLCFYLAYSSLHLPCFLLGRSLPPGTVVVAHLVWDSRGQL